VAFIGLDALVRAVARWSSDILPSWFIAGSIDNISKLPDLLQRPASLEVSSHGEVRAGLNYRFGGMQQSRNIIHDVWHWFVNWEMTSRF
jgi:hypothetical protein